MTHITVVAEELNGNLEMAQSLCGRLQAELRRQEDSLVDLHRMNAEKQSRMLSLQSELDRVTAQLKQVQDDAEKKLKVRINPTFILLKSMDGWIICARLLFSDSYHTPPLATGTLRDHGEPGEDSQRDPRRSPERVPGIASKVCGAAHSTFWVWLGKKLCACRPAIPHRRANNSPARVTDLSRCESSADELKELTTRYEALTEVHAACGPKIAGMELL